MVMRSQYPGTCKACGCRFDAGETIEWTRGSGARHATIDQCHEAMAKRQKAAEARASGTLETLNLKPIADFLLAARSRGLKAPKLRVLAPDGKTEMRLTITKTGREPGSISVVIDNNFIGCVRKDGTMTSRLAEDRTLQKHLLTVAENPVSAVKEYAALMGRCSFCDALLTDAGSVEVGYGPVCAKHWGLPHCPKGIPSLGTVPNGDTK